MRPQRFEPRIEIFESERDARFIAIARHLCDRPVAGAHEAVRGLGGLMRVRAKPGPAHWDATRMPAPSRARGDSRAPLPVRRGRTKGPARLAKRPRPYGLPRASWPRTRPAAPVNRTASPAAKRAFSLSASPAINSRALRPPSERTPARSRALVHAVFRDANARADKPADLTFVIGIVANPCRRRTHSILTRDLGQQFVLAIGRRNNITATFWNPSLHTMRACAGAMSEPRQTNAAAAARGFEDRAIDTSPWGRS